MIFRAAMLAKVLDGSKTVTRRPAQLLNDGEGPAAPCRYQVGRDYAIQPGRGRHAVGRLRVVSLRILPLDHIAGAEARREGFEDRAAFFAYWTELYGTPQLRAPVWRIAFDLMASDPSGTPPPRPDP